VHFLRLQFLLSLSDSGSKSDKQAKRCICGVQCDQVQNGVQGCDDKEMRDYCQHHGFDAWFETSAKDNINIEEAARFLVARVRAIVLSIVAVSLLRCLTNFY